MTDKRCGTCHYWRPSTRSKIYGDCSLVPESDYPFWVDMRKATTISKSYGTDCRCWKSNDKPWSSSQIHDDPFFKNK